MHRTVLPATIVLAIAAAPVSAQLLIPDSDSDSIGLYSAADGSLIDANFITDANDANTYDFATPIEAIQVGNEIFVSDQIADAIFIFDLSGNYVDKIDSGLDNLRGIAAVNGTVYAANGGGNNGAPEDQIVTIDAATRSITGSFGFGPPDFSPFDVEVFGNVLLVSDIDGGPSSNPFNTEGVDAFNFDGSYIGRVVSVGTTDPNNGPDFPEQIAGKISDSNFLVAGFSAPAGVYEFENDGDFVDVYAEGFGGRGVAELGNGNYIYTKGNGAFVFDPAGPDGEGTTVGDGNRFISRVAIPEPTTLGLLAVGGLCVLRRRR